MPIDPVTLLIGGMVYGGWKEITIERGIDRAVSSFDVRVSERWAGQGKAWQITPFSAVQLFVSSDLLLTGYVGAYVPSWTSKEHSVRVRGHSKTIDLTQCNPDIKSGQFSGFTVAAIARSICALFGITVVVQTDLANQVVENTNLQRSETAFTFLERLGRLAGVLLYDDPKGNLVLATAGSVKASSTLVQGQNIMAANAMINVDRRHSIYIVKGQAGVGYGATPATSGDDGEMAAPVGTVQTQMQATALDTAVPRYRPKVTIAESQLTLAQMKARANWQKQFAFGQATKANITVPGFRQADGSLWTVNQIVACTVPWLEIDADLLVASVKFSLDEKSSGHRTELMLGPVEGYAPDPAEVKLHKAKGAKGGKGAGKGINWSGVGGKS